MTTKVCLVQDSPVFFDKTKTLEKVEVLTKKFAMEGCELIVFPESFVPGYPRGFDFGATIGSRTSDGRTLYNEYHRNSFNTESDDLKKMEQLAKSQNVYLVLGVTEKDSTSGSLYCSMLYISPRMAY